jgi:DNA-binding response OmpR family regulator
MPKNIVWIEDDAPIIEPVVRPLRNAGYQIVVYPTVSEALEAVEEMRTADLILLDMILPPGSSQQELGPYPGLFILRQLRKKHDVTTPVIAFTVVTRDRLVGELRELGVADVLNKPILPSELKQRVEEVLSSSS